jgi:hypothetical protein
MPDPALCDPTDRVALHFVKPEPAGLRIDPYRLDDVDLERSVDPACTACP